MSQQVVSFNNEFSMSSYEFLTTVINPAREKAGEKPVRNYVFIERVYDELDGYQNLVSDMITPAGGGTPMETVILNGDQLLLVGMRESKAVRRKVLEYIRRIEKDKQLLEDQKKRAAVQSANRRGVTWGDYCKAHGLPTQKLLAILKLERKLFRVNPISGEWSVSPTFADYFRVIKPNDHRFSQKGINIRFNAKGLEFFSQPEHVLKMRGKVIAIHGTDADKQRHLQDVARLEATQKCRWPNHEQN
ncbi:hypothetical protein MYG01_06250 [Citrobacter amalonaticus]|uniref:hypothetical protein n=1 Tax=Citrobacter amalonaticus TaxID=35703 RepID=UPI0020BD74A0|nr:hypothetical protein [Citrobacter amalonaticus]MCK8151469.1 hypothetical protein [Citrobacter amalonaticus]